MLERQDLYDAVEYARQIAEDIERCKSIARYVSEVPGLPLDERVQLDDGYWRAAKNYVWPPVTEESEKGEAQP